MVNKFFRRSWLLVLALFLFLPFRGEAKEGWPVRPYPGISAEELMRIYYLIQYSTFAQDIQMEFDFYLIDKGGGQRLRKGFRKRIILKEKGIEYKDIVTLTYPTNIKGLSVLTWSYTDPHKEREQWLWLPSLKKDRRTSPAEGDASFMGSDFTTEEITSRRWEDETYQMIKEDNYPGYSSKFTKETYYKDLPCYVVEARPKKKGWYYSHRVIWLSKETGASIFEEIYDPAGRKVRTLFRRYEEFPPNEYLGQVHLEAYDLRTDHLTVILNKNIKYDTGLKEGSFTVTELRRMKW